MFEMLAVLLATFPNVADRPAVVNKKISELSARCALETERAAVAVAKIRPTICSSCKMGEQVITEDAFAINHSCTLCDYRFRLPIGD